MFRGQNDKATRQEQLGRLFQALASMPGRPLTFAVISPLLGKMFRKKSPRLAAAFVVTISAGCGGASTPPEHGTNGTSTTGSDGPTAGTDDPKKPDGPQKPDGPENQDWVPNIGSVKEGFIKGNDGKCYIQHPANPPWMEPVDCETQKPLDKPEETPKPAPTTLTPVKPDDSNLPAAPAGWRVEHYSDGSCKAFAPSVSCRSGMRCNPPPPRNVKCSGSSDKSAGDPQQL